MPLSIDTLGSINRRVMHGMWGLACRLELVCRLVLVCRRVLVCKLGVLVCIQRVLGGRGLDGKVLGGKELDELHMMWPKWQQKCPIQPSFLSWKHKR